MEHSHFQLIRLRALVVLNPVIRVKILKKWDYSVSGITATKMRVAMTGKHYLREHQAHRQVNHVLQPD